MANFTEQDFVHAPTDDPDWQESFVLLFRDLDSDLVGFFRVGCFPNKGTAQTHFGLALPDGTRFRRHRLDLPFAAEDWSRNRAKSGPLTYEIVEGEYIRFTGKEDEAEFDLRLYDFFPSENWRIADPNGEAIAKRIGGIDHPEASGRVEGTVRIGDRVIEVTNGLGHRDHAFGGRKHQSILNNRWIAGTVGPELCFSCVSVQMASGDYLNAAWVSRNGKVEHAQSVKTAAIVLPDGLSTIGGWTEIILDSGERLVIDAEVIDGIVTSSDMPNGGPGSSPAGVEGLAKARWNGMEGVCDFNIIVNPLNGEAPVSKLMRANHADGLSEHDPTSVDWAYRMRHGDY